MVSKRLDGLKPSAIRIISDGAPADAIALGLGEPTWDLPEPARRALAAFEGPCPYGLNAGTAELRAAIATQHGVDPERVLVSCGTQGVLFCMFQAWLDPGDQVVLPDPGFVGYLGLTRLASAEAVTYPLPPETRYRLDADVALDALRRAERAKVMLLNHPGNPTGAGADADALRRVAAACAERGVLLLSDEVYGELYYDRKPTSLLDVTDRGVMISSVSKAYGAPGLRVGWGIGPPDLLAPARVVHAYMATAVALPAQRAAVALLQEADAVLADARDKVRVRFEALQRALKQHLDVDAPPPDGGFYYRLPLPDAAQADPVAFCIKLRDEAKVVIVPGSAFGDGGRAFARLSFAAAPEQIEEGVRRLAPFLRA